MMWYNPFVQFLILLMTHYVADFIAQTHWQASNKSKNIDALIKHVTNYTLIMMIPVTILWWGTTKEAMMALVWFWVITYFSHFATDFFTSRWSSQKFKMAIFEVIPARQAQAWHNFFVVIGLDQLIHQVTLALTLWFIFFRI